MTRAFCRAYLIVTLTSANVSMIANHRWLLMALTGGLLSYVWVGNTRAAVGTGRGWRLMYAAGAAAGTVTGAWLAGWL